MLSLSFARYVDGVNVAAMGFRLYHFVCFFFFFCSSSSLSSSSVYWVSDVVSCRVYRRSLFNSISIESSESLVLRLLYIAVSISLTLYYFTHDIRIINKHNINHIECLLCEIKIHAKCKRARIGNKNANKNHKIYGQRARAGGLYKKQILIIIMVHGTINRQYLMAPRTLI